ncbi:urotensin-2-like [Synchiropus splendidus]|uniref:urotensin-2-like n=1 Tax=Synchiropus splendidus TaxID=270530 RepID=UPI00237E571F|nr:urotensin-2-like [Synchiropus splendidus]
MKWKLCWALILVASGPLLAHPITESAEMSYPELVAEEPGRRPMVDLTLSDRSFPSSDGAALRYSSPVDISRDGFRNPALLSRGMNSEVLLEKQSLLKPFSRLLGIHKQFRKRGGDSECFWKYCV